MADTTTDNGDAAFSTTGGAVLDFFVQSVRGRNIESFISDLNKAWAEDARMTMKGLLNLRDVRGGKGERHLFYVGMAHILNACLVTDEILEVITEVGCFRDLIMLWKLGVDTTAYYRRCLERDQSMEPWENISLAAKWAPNEHSQYHDYATKLSKSKWPKYRKLLRGLRERLKLVETQMSQHHWQDIVFSAIPSKAHRIYRGAFGRNTNAEGERSKERYELMRRYQRYQLELKSGTEKINVTGTQPHELVKCYLKSENAIIDETIEAQWLGLVKRCRESGTFRNAIAISDVSGSMNGTPLQVSIALGILLSQCVDSRYANKLITFSNEPTFIEMKEGQSLLDRISLVKSAEWCMNTDLHKVFKLLLTTAKVACLLPSEMIQTIFIFTDMQFDEASASSDERMAGTFKRVSEEYRAAGYDEMPRIVCWNLRESAGGSFPVKKNANGVIYLSGFSAELLKWVMKTTTFDPATFLNESLAEYDKYLSAFEGLNWGMQLPECSVEFLDRVSSIGRSLKTSRHK